MGVRLYLGGRLDGGAWPRYAVLGQPVAHSLSPVLHAAALAARGEAGEYAAIEVAPAELRDCLAAARAAGVEGLNLTLPHKRAGLAAAVGAGGLARRIGAANTLVAHGDGWWADNTDAPGLGLVLAALGAPRGGRAVVLGGGGAARAAVAALEEHGCHDVSVLVREPARASWAGERAARLDDPALGTAGIVVHCTPVGLDAGDPPLVDAARLDRGALLVDTLYGRHTPPLVAAARARGLRAVDGRGMLVAQAALSFARWRGGEPPLDAMAAAIGLDWPPA